MLSREEEEGKPTIRASDQATRYTTWYLLTANQCLCTRLVCHRRERPSKLVLYNLWWVDFKSVKRHPTVSCRSKRLCLNYVQQRDRSGVACALDLANKCNYGELVNVSRFWKDDRRWNYERLDLASMRNELLDEMRLWWCWWWLSKPNSALSHCVGRVVASQCGRQPNHRIMSLFAPICSGLLSISSLSGR